MLPEPPAPPTSPHGFSNVPTAATTSLSNSINSDIACRRCDYNLRGLREDMACPECGTAVGLSTQGAFLRYSEPAWVETIARGSSIILWSVLAQFVAVMVGVWIQSMTGNSLTLLMLSLVASLITVAGVWKLTTREAAGSERDRADQSRELTRVTLLVIVAASIVALGGEFLPTGRSRTLFTQLFGLVAGLVSAANAFFLYSYIEHLTTRVPDELLTKRAAFLRIAFVVVIVPMQLLTVYVNLSAMGQLGMVIGGPLDGLRIANAIIQFMAFVLSVMGILFQFRLSRRLREQARHARNTWAAKSAMPHPS